MTVQPVPDCAPDDDDEPNPLADDEMALWLSFLQAATLTRESLDRALARHDLTLEDYEILVYLSEAPGRRLVMSDLADSVLAAKSRLTYRVDRLERRGAVARSRCGEDGRRVWATLTPKGFALLESAWPAHLASVRRFVVDPVTRRDVRAATRALRAMTTAVRDAKCED
jgi:DNA-binding MarR family transcriptional regulator